MMSHISLYHTACGTLVLLAAAAGTTAEAQNPGTRSQTSVVQRLTDSSATASVTGRMRELKCRGKPGIAMQVHQAPSPRHPQFVTMVLRYERPRETRSFGQEGMGLVDYGRSIEFHPGSCTWGAGTYPDIPPEPGVVYFDLPRDGQPHLPGARDTSMAAAAHYPDPISLPLYLSDSNRYWVFYVDDVTNVSISFGQMGGPPAPTHAGVTGSLRDASPGSATLTSARVLSDSQRTTVVRVPNTVGGAAGSLRGSGAGATTAASTTLRDTAIMRSPGDRAPLTDTTARRTATVRPPTPAPAPPANVGGSLRGGTPAATSSVRTGASLPAGPGAARPSRTLLPDVRIWGVATAPGSRGVRLVFNTDREFAGFGGRVGILVTFSQQRPPWDSARSRWAYPPGWNSPWAAEITSPEHGGYMAEPYGRLELREQYYYLITVESNDASLPPRQVIGSFIASNNPFAKAPPAPGPEPASSEDFGDALRSDATDAAGALRDQPAGAATAAGTTVRLPAAGASTSPGISRTRLPPDVRIWAIETRPGDNGVTLWFETDRVWVRGSSRGVRVQFSTRQPEWEGGLLVSPAVASEWREVTSGRFEAEPHWTLESGKRYYYLITVESNDATLRPRQATGSFLAAFGG